MHITSITPSPRAVSLNWSDGSSQLVPYIWLRDNDPTELHPKTRERTFDLLSVSLDVKPVEISCNPTEINLLWPNRLEHSIYSAEWLLSHRVNGSESDPSAVNRTPWTTKSMLKIPRFSAVLCRDPIYLKSALVSLKESGLIIINELSDDPDAGSNFANQIGFKRETNFGVMFDVISKPDPNNLAYTSLALPLHTDLPNQEAVPGFQFLHCYVNNSAGGESLFADGLAIAQQFSITNPEHYSVLAHTDIPWRFHDQTCDIRHRRPIISLDQNGQFKSFTFNAHIADVLDLPTSEIYSFYAAYRALMEVIRRDEFKISYRLMPGEMAVFDNHRVLHGREAFDPASGSRHLRGYYVEHNEIDSCIRVLTRTLAHGAA